MTQLPKYKLLIKLNSIKRFKDFRNIEKIEYIEPFLRKKNVKFLKRNRFINFLYTYSFSVRRLHWNRKNQTLYLKRLKNEVLSFIENRILYYNSIYDKIEIETLINFKNIFSRYIQFRMNTLIDFYNNEIKSKEIFFNEHFPQDMISPHRKRRVMTYIRRFTITGRKLPSYISFKSDLLYILTSRKKTKEVIVSTSKMIDKNILKFVEKKNKDYYNQTLNEVNSWLMYKISFFLNFTEFSELHYNELKLNGKFVLDYNDSIKIGDCIELRNPKIQHFNSKLFIFFLIFKLCLSFKKKKHYY